MEIDGVKIGAKKKRKQRKLWLIRKGQVNPKLRPGSPEWWAIQQYFMW